MEQEIAVEAPAGIKVNRDWIGSILGLCTFFFGIFLLSWVFKLAFDQFTVPPKIALEIQKPGQPVNINKAGDAVAGLVLKFLLLLLMAGVSSIIANRGIHLYSQSRGFKK